MATMTYYTKPGGKVEVDWPLDQRPAELRGQRLQRVILDIRNSPSLLAVPGYYRRRRSHHFTTTAYVLECVDPRSGARYQHLRISDENEIQAQAFLAQILTRKVRPTESFLTDEAADRPAAWRIDQAGLRLAAAFVLLRQGRNKKALDELRALAGILGVQIPSDLG